MGNYIVIALLALVIVLPIGLYYMGERKRKRYKRMLSLNLVSFFAMLVFATVYIFSGTASAATEATAAAGDMSAGLAYLAAAISTGLGSIGAGVATGQAASAALGALSENEGVMGKALIFVALAEGVAIYGMIIAVLILGRV